MNITKDANGGAYAFLTASSVCSDKLGEAPKDRLNLVRAVQLRAAATH